MPSNPADDELAAAISALSPEEQQELEAALSGGNAPSPAPAPTSPAPSPAGPISRFLAPIGTAIKGLASLPGTVGGAILRGEYGEMTNALGQGVVQPSIEQGRQAGAAAERGDLGQAAMHALATLDVGGAGADIGESAAEGNLAGAAGQAAVAFAPFGRAARPATRAAGALKNRAAARILDVMRPRQSAVAGAEEVADAVASGVAGREAAGGIGVGSLETLAARAKARTTSAGDTLKALQTLDTPLDPTPVSRGLRTEARSLETTPPPRTVFDEVDTGILDEFGDPIMGVKSSVVKGTPTSAHPALVSALDHEAKFIDDLAAQYPDELVPAGEMFKQRAALGRRVSKSYGVGPGEESAAGQAAGKSSRAQISRLLHDEVPASIIPDAEYRTFKTAWTNFERHRRANLTNRGLKGLKDLLAGRAVAAGIGGLTGAVSFGPMGGVAGALGGVLLGESAYWGSLRAATYADLARHLNSGQLDKAAEILQRTSAAYAVEKGIGERERNRKAQRALQEQAEGVIAP